MALHLHICFVKNMFRSILYLLKYEYRSNILQFENGQRKSLETQRDTYAVTMKLEYYFICFKCFQHGIICETSSGTSHMHSPSKSTILDRLKLLFKSQPRFYGKPCFLTPSRIFLQILPLTVFLLIVFSFLT